MMVSHPMRKNVPPTNICPDIKVHFRPNFGSLKWSIVTHFAR